MTLFYWISAGVVIAALCFLGVPMVRAILKYRGTRVINCPETEQPAAVEVDAVRAAIPGSGTRNLVLKDCTRWPEREDCGQECLRQIEQSPEGCLVRTMVRQWYSDKSCSVCGKALGDIDWMQHRPCILRPDGATAEWTEIQAERIPEVMASYRPICWDCHIAIRFRRQYPDLVTDRPWQKSDTSERH